MYSYGQVVKEMKPGLTLNWFDGASLPSVVFSKGFAECKRHSANWLPAVVRALDFLYVDFAPESRKTHVDVHNLARSMFTFEKGRHIWLLETPVGVCNSYDQLHE